jgi:hypothetical protein
VEDPVVIDAKSFANSYNAFWSEAAPTCEHFVRRLNLESVERFEPPLPSPGSSRAALIAEFAFSLFVERKREGTRKAKRSKAEIAQAAWTSTEKRLSPYADQGLDVNRRFSDQEAEEIGTISDRLSLFFKNAEERLILRPMFAGCGFVDGSEGDIISDDTICEIKTVQRSFRSSDLKQAVTYAALNYSSKQYPIENVSIVNPRSGLFVTTTLENLCLGISGAPAQNFFETIIQTLSSGEVSR